MPPKKKDAAAAKAARQKKILIVLSLVFVVVFVVMVLPKLTGGPGAGPPVAVGAVTTATGTSTTPAATPPAASPVALTTPLPTGGSAQLSAPSYSFSASDAQLGRFVGKLRTKDPFAGGTGAATVPVVTSPAVTLADVTTPAVNGTTPGSTVPGTTQPAAAPFIYAIVSVNGVAEGVALEGFFPAQSPLFRLLAIGKSSIKFSLLAGSFTSGTPTITLLKGRSVTIRNTADGSRYVLQLVTTSRTTPANAGQPTTQTSTDVLDHGPDTSTLATLSTSTTGTSTDTSTPPPPTTPSS